MQDAAVRGDWARRAKEAQCVISQPSSDKPHWALSSRQAGRRGGGRTGRARLVRCLVPVVVSG